MAARGEQVADEAETGAPAILLGGPTASGKSDLAMRLADALGGVLINADSMQVYRDLRILTARPGADDETRHPHRLYGCLDAARRCSVGLWRRCAVAAARDGAAQGLVPILVGGTGMYLAAFRHGLSPVPRVPGEVRAAVVRQLAASGPEALHRRLAEVDPDLAGVLAPGDSQRIVRALEVFEATGTPLSAWRRLSRKGGWPGPVLQITVAPPRDALYRLCDDRFDAMMSAGALEEVERLAERRLDRSLPAMRALGVPFLMAFLEGRLDCHAAVERAKTGTRRYAKRQTTWFRHQVGDALRIEAFGFDPDAGCALAAARRFLLTGEGSPA